jgi:hypothetical protein
MTTQLRAVHDATTTNSRLATHADPTLRGARLAATGAVSTSVEFHAVIPGRAEGASPESITTDGDYGFRAPSLRSGPGMTPRDGRKSTGKYTSARIPRRRRASLAWVVAFRLWAAAGGCLAADGATASQATLSPACAAADRRLLTLIEEHGEAADVTAETLAKAFFTMLEARKVCRQGQVEAALELYESVPLRAITSPRP